MAIRLILVIFLAGFTAFSQQMPPIGPGVSQELAKWRASQYSNISYKLNLTLEKMSPVLKGTIEIHVTQAAYGCAEPNCPPLYIMLDWRKLPGHEQDSAISNVTINGIAATVVREPPPGTNISTSGNPQPLPRGLNFDKVFPPPSPRPTPSPSVDCFERSDHLIFNDGVRMGENVIKLDFTSPILTSGSAITRYVDKEDGAEYIYSLFVPSDASTAFPCFDQPDLKARFKLDLITPASWMAVSNTDAKDFSGHLLPSDLNEMFENPRQRFEFAETQPISSYLFAFAAGPFKVVDESGISKEITGFRQPRMLMKSKFPHDTDPKWSPNTIQLYEAREGARVFVRRSQAAKFQPHAAEVFRLTREGVKYLETYFDYKFPFPKYDLVLIPEFPFGGMEHAGAIFLREDRVIFPAEPTKGDHITRANLIFHETAHQWFGDTVTMKWFDDLWLKEGFAEFMAYKTLERVMPDANAWKVFYERNKQAAYLTDSTKGTTPIYQPIANLSAAKSAYGNIVYRKAPSFLRQAEFYLGEDKFQTAVRAFLKKHEFGNAGWEGLVKEFEAASKDPRKQDLSEWAEIWVKRRGVFKIVITSSNVKPNNLNYKSSIDSWYKSDFPDNNDSEMLFNSLAIYGDGTRESVLQELVPTRVSTLPISWVGKKPVAIIPNYQDYGYGIFLLDDKSRDYVIKNIQNEKDPFLRSMMWGSLWDSVREAELDPKDYVELAIKNLPTENDETISQSILSRVSTAMNYYLSAALAAALAPRFEAVLLDRLQHAPAAGQRITFYRAFVANASTAKGREVLKEMLRQSVPRAVATGVLKADAKAPVATAPGTDKPTLRTKDRFDIVTRLTVLGDPDAPRLLAELEKTETSDDAKRYAYAARAAFGTGENKAKFWNDFVTNKDISESWIESAIVPFNSIRHSDLTQQYLQRALTELPNLKRTRKIFFINNWLAAFIGGQRDEKALGQVNKFLADNPNLDNDLRLKVLENVDLIERAVKIRAKFGGS